MLTTAETAKRLSLTIPQLRQHIYRTKRIKGVKRAGRLFFTEQAITDFLSYKTVLPSWAMSRQEVCNYLNITLRTLNYFTYVKEKSDGSPVLSARDKINGRTYYDKEVIKAHKLENK